MTEDPKAVQLLKELGSLSEFQPTRLSQMKRYIEVGKEIYKFAIEPDKEGQLRAIGISLFNAGMCLAISLAKKHMVAWIAGAIGGPIPLILIIALTSASLLHH